MGLLINNAEVIGVAMETTHLVKEVLEGDRVLCEEMLWCFGKHPDLEQKPGAESRNYETIHLFHPLPSLFPPPTSTPPGGACHSTHAEVPGQ